jgi:hypothetical protein
MRLGVLVSAAVVRLGRPRVGVLSRALNLFARNKQQGQRGHRRSEMSRLCGITACWQLGTTVWMVLVSKFRHIVH